MKKTNSMRVAVAMLALTLITSCFVGGTFAKYTKSANDGDSARVAKFGVEIKAGKSTFLDKYEKNDNTYTGQYSVASSDGAKVVAPGTSGSIELFSISGTPEVAVKVTTKMTHDDSEGSIWLEPIESFQKVMTINVTVQDWEYGGGGTLSPGGDGTVTFEPYPVGNPITTTNTDRDKPVSADEYETRPTGDIVTNTKTEEQIDDWSGDPSGKKDTTTETITEYEPTYDEKYYPIKWTLKNGETTLIESGKLSDVKAYFDGDAFNKEYGPGNSLSDISGTYTLEWEWPFEGDDTANKYDTALGNIMAGKYGIYEDGEFNLTEAFDFSITVEQIN